jgi:hypothetical protein
MAPRVYNHAAYSPQVRMGSGPQNAQKTPHAQIAKTIEDLGGELKKYKPNDKTEAAKPGTYSYEQTITDGFSKLNGALAKSDGGGMNRGTMLLIIGAVGVVGYYFYYQNV